MTSAKRRKNPIAAAPRHSKGLHIVALFEGAKGVLVLLAGFGLLALIHKDVHEIAARLIANFHFNPASHYPRIFLDLLERLDDHKLWAMAWAALLYSTMRLAEAIGLWLRKKWAEWFGVLSGGIYLPVEIYELSLGITWPKVTVFVINLGVVLYLLFVLIRNGGTTSGVRLDFQIFDVNLPPWLENPAYIFLLPCTTLSFAVMQVIRFSFPIRIGIAFTISSNMLLKGLTAGSMHFA